MNKDRGPDRATADPNEDAAAWVVRLGSDQRTRGDEEAFAAWMAADPGNPADYLDHADLWHGLGALAEDDEARAILGAPGPDRPADPEGDRIGSPPLPFGKRIRTGVSRRGLFAGMALAAAASAAYVVLPSLLLSGHELYETAIGEQRRLLLADGSAITLNTDSALRIELTESERRLFLDRGQAHFQVAHDVSRPFRVFVGNDEVRALGTEFGIWRTGDTAKVTLAQGSIAIYRDSGSAALPRPIRPGDPSNGPGPRPALLLRPGQQADLAPATARLAVREVDVAATQAWRTGRMILDDVPLGEVVADINRYGGRRIILADPALQRLRVSGVFHTSQPDALVDGLTAALPVRIARQDASSLTLEAQ